MKSQKDYLKLKIGISGSAKNNCFSGTEDKAFQLGREVARQGCILVNGATSGIPQVVAKGAKSERGVVIGISPAISQKEHRSKYKLPLEYTDLVVYTGMDYAGRNFLFVRSSDAMIFVCGRIGTLNEFTVAFEDRKPIGILTETGGMADEIEEILEVARRGKRDIIFDNDPKRLVEQVIKLAKKRE